jgi:DNA-binding MltR family transcriptional regulator
MVRASSTDVLNEKLNIKKYYFDFFLLILHILKEVLNKMLKCLFSPINVISTYL